MNNKILDFIEMNCNEENRRISYIGSGKVYEYFLSEEIEKNTLIGNGEIEEYGSFEFEFIKDLEGGYSLNIEWDETEEDEELW